MIVRHKALGLLLKLLFGGIASFLLRLGLAVRNVIIINTYQRPGEVVSSRRPQRQIVPYEIRVRYDGLKAR